VYDQRFGIPFLPSWTFFLCGYSHQPYTGCVSESGDFKNVMNSKCFCKFVKRFHSKSTLCSIAPKTLYSWQQNGDSGIRLSVAKPDTTVLQNRPIH
jgi:hypothetical protein